MLMTIVWIILALAVCSFAYGAFEGIQQAKARVRDEKTKADRVRPAQEKVIAFLDKRQSLALPAIPVRITDDVSDGLLQSRLGGKPAWPDGKPYPQSRGNFPLCFLAQINLTDMPAMDGFPSDGLLQFYFAADDVYGMTFPDGQSDGRTIKSDILVIHHSVTDDMHLWTQFEAEDEVYKLDVPFTYDDWWHTGYKLAFDPACEMKPTYRGYQIYDDYIALGKLFTNKDKFHAYADKWDLEEPTSIVIGGHPHFTQMDPRYNKPDLQDYARVLMSIPSVNGKIMWGDVGTASFLIKPENLAAGDFSDILYNYDCY